jgi:hypothetical protein
MHHVQVGNGTAVRKAAALVAPLALLLGLTGAGCGGGSSATPPNSTDAQVLALARLDRPSAPAAGQECVADWLRSHVSKSDLARFIEAKTPEQGLKTPGLPSALLAANAACARQLGL